MHLEALAQQHLHPAFLGEQFRRAVLEETARRAKQFDPLVESVRNLHRPDMIPERLAAAPGDLIVSNDEVAYVFIFGARLEVVLVDVGRRNSVRRKHRQQPVDRRLDEVNAGRLERLEKARRQANRDDVLLPGFQPPTGPEPDGPRIGQRLSVEVGEKTFPLLRR